LNNHVPGGNTAWKGTRRSYESWRSAAEITIFVKGLPQDVTTTDIWRWFNGEGDLSFIDIFSDDHIRDRTRKGLIRFRYSPDRFT
jgi:hypothetical protein